MSGNMIKVVVVASLELYDLQEQCPYSIPLQE